MTFQLFNTQNAPEGAQENLKAIESEEGFVPNLAGVLAGAPVVLDAFLSLRDHAEKTSFSPAEREVIFLTVSHRNGSAYCMAADKRGKKNGNGRSGRDTLSHLLAGEPLQDRRLEALRRYTLGIMDNYGRPSDDRIEAFLAAGYTPAQALEIVLCIAFKTLTNYTARLTHPEVDSQFSPRLDS